MPQIGWLEILSVVIIAILVLGPKEFPIALKKIGTKARIDLEKFFGKKVFIELHVKVSKNWRSNPNQLKKFGYRN